MAVRNVFFSFHYDNDVLRANVVRNSDQIRKHYKQKARFHDRSLWEEAKLKGASAIKKLIDDALDGTSVTCVLVGQHTWGRRWVRYELLKSLAVGNGILGIQIHDTGIDPKPTPGPNPLNYLGYIIQGDMVYFYKKFEQGWKVCSDISAIPLQSWPWRSKLPKNRDCLANLFKVYRWSRNGFNHFPDWADAAAHQAGR